MSIICKQNSSEMSTTSDDLDFDIQEFADEGLKKPSRQAYKQSYMKFISFANSKGYAFETRGPAMDDKLVCSYLGSLKESKTKRGASGIEKIGSAGVGERLISAIRSRCPSVDLPFSTKFLRKWRKQNRPFRTEAMPFSKPHVLALIGLAITRAQFRRALLYTSLWLAWLRVSEGLSLTTQSISWRKHEGKRNLVFTLHDTKTQHAEAVNCGDDSETFVTLFDCLLQKVEGEGHGMTTRFGPAKKLFPWSSSTVRSFLRTDAATVGIKAVLNSRISTHSFRRGGASEAYYNKVGLLEIKLRGRWRSEKSLEIYIRDSHLLLANSSTDSRGMEFLCTKARSYISDFKTQSVSLAR